MNFRGFRHCYARYGLNPNKRDKPDQMSEKKEEPDLVKRVKRENRGETLRKYETNSNFGLDAEKTRNYDSDESIKNYDQ